MPPGHHSSSSHSSHSHSSHHSSHHSSSSHSSRSHSSSYSHSSSSHSSTTPPRKVTVPKSAPSHIKSNSLFIRGSKHHYIYYDTDWFDEKTAKSYHKGYYDEDGKHYDADDIVFRNPDGSYKAHFSCEYCGAEAEYTYSEGQYPNCQSCGAQMIKSPTYIDDILDVTKGYTNTRTSSISQSPLRFIVWTFATMIGLQFLLTFATGIVGATFANKAMKNQDTTRSVESGYVSNIDIYGTDLYLVEVEEDVYEIGDSSAYDKHLKWDYGADSYFDRESDCYIWYNTDVSPNLWQYWYDEVSGNNEYGWMEYEGGKWYLEVGEGEWDEYTVHRKLWHIRSDID